MNKKLVVVQTTLLLGISSYLVLPSAYAEPSSQAEINEQRSQLQSEMEKVDQDLEETEDELSQINGQIERIEKAISENNKMMEETEQKIADANEEVEQFQVEIEELEADIAERYELLKNRAVAFQKSGGPINYLDVIMGSKGFMDFINRVSVVTTLVEADAELLEKDQADRDTLESKQSAVEQKLAELSEMETELEGIQQIVLAQKQENEQLKAELEEKKQGSLDEKSNLQQQESYLAVREQELRNNNQPKVQTFSASSNSGSSSVGSGSVSTVVNAGKKYIGNSAYKYGGGRTASDIANGLFDCSAFIHWAFAQAGVNVSYSTAGLSGQGERVSPSEMKPGDLVFFDTYKKNGHVGIYMGNGKFIGSQSSRGVEIENMSMSYWKNTFSGHVRRIL